MQHKPKRGTKPASRMAASQSRIRPASVRMAPISLICVIPTATKSLGLLVRRADCHHKTGEGLKLARAVLSGTVLLRKAFAKDLADVPGGAARIDASREAVRCGYEARIASA